MIRFGICNELFVDQELPEICTFVKSLGYDGLELAPFTLAPTITELSSERRAEVRRIIADAGLETIGLHWLLAKTNGLHLTSTDAGVRQRTADYLKALAEASRDLGGTLMVLGSPDQRNLPEGVSYEQGVDYALDVLGQVTTTLDAAEVDLCFEPLSPKETDFVNTCAQTVALLDQLGHPRVKLHMDVKAQSAEPNRTVPELIGQFASRTGHFHANDVNLRGPGMGAIDFDPILKALVASPYDGWVSVEVFDFEPGAQATAQQSIACLRSAFEKAS